MTDDNSPDDESPDDFDGVDWAEKLLGPSVGDQIEKYYENLERDGGYTKDWEFVSWEYRSSRDFECELCSVSLVNHKNLLHVHHRDEDKGNNDPSNLLALCVLCHAQHHAHMTEGIAERDRNFILALRRAHSPDSPSESET